MGAERPEIIREMLESDWNSGDIDSLVERCSDDMAWHPLVVTSFEGDGKVYRGKDGFREFVEGWTNTWDTWNLKVEELRVYGDQVLALTHVHAKGLGSGVEFDQDMAHLFEFRGNEVCRGESFLHRDMAIAAAERRAEGEEEAA
jgi:ketosteroid isomerase-like protein